MSGGFGLCGVCCREIPMKRDGRLRAHLARSSTTGGRQQCDGSGAWSARLELLAGHAAELEHPTMSRAAAFNARDAWCQVDSLYAEFEDMKLTGACSMSALKEARDAVNRALAEAEALAPWWAVQTFAGDG